MSLLYCCCQSVKDKNFESNSQPVLASYPSSLVVVSLSKIKISKAIHNSRCAQRLPGGVVVSLSKIKISKAIHNIRVLRKSRGLVVVSLSKIKISKAIHNQPD